MQAEHLKQYMDASYGSAWHCFIMNGSHGYFYSHTQNRSISFSFGDHFFFLFCTPTKWNLPILLVAWCVCRFFTVDGHLFPYTYLLTVSMPWSDLFAHKTNKFVGFFLVKKIFCSCHKNEVVDAFAIQFQLREIQRSKLIILLPGHTCALIISLIYFSCIHTEKVDISLIYPWTEFKMGLENCNVEVLHL